MWYLEFFSYHKLHILTESFWFVFHVCVADYSEKSRQNSRIKSISTEFVRDIFDEKAKDEGGPVESYNRHTFQLLGTCNNNDIIFVLNYR